MKICLALDALKLTFLCTFVKIKTFDRVPKISSDLPLANAPTLIPKVFHHVWFDFGKGNKPLEKYEKNVRKLKELHPDWEFVTWTEEQVVNLLRAKFRFFLETFMSYDRPIKKHDAARIAILHEHGGAYIDHDYVPLKNLDPLLKSYNFVVGSESVNFSPTNSFIATVPRFSLLENILQYMNNPSIARMNVLDATGPYMLKKVMSEFIMKNTFRGIKVYAQQFFNPINWSNKQLILQMSREALENLRKEAYMHQTYDCGWW